MNNTLLLMTADAILVLHLLTVMFVVFGLLLIYAGQVAGWPWVRNFWFRVAHLACIGVVVAQSWFGVHCFLTIWEQQLREAAGTATYSGAFIQHWLQAILFYDAPAWVFITLYTAFGALVLLSWWLVPPARQQKAPPERQSK
ncbi:MAG: DUF2784 domain-containing protein [Gammaproteobacteria bacterium]|nr:DUF2784 domain-containing protein [Gammaproteobacteria bacterium]